MPSDRVRVVVEIERGEPVSGSAAREGESPVPFEGMLGFLSLLEQLRTCEDPPRGRPARGDAERR